MENRTIKSLRSAVRSGSWSQAEALLGVLQREAELAWKAATDEGQRLAIRNEVFELLEWTRSMTLAGRAHSRANLIRLSRQGEYLRT